jgi:hypothetical protein
LVQKFIFVILVPGWERKKRGHWIPVVKKENIVDTDLCHQNSRCLCQMTPFDEESSYRCFFTFKVHDKTYMSSVWFFVLGWFWFLERCFGFS